MTAVLNWIKANVFIVVFVGVMIAALVGFPMAASRMNAKIRADMHIRSDKNMKLDSLKKTPIELGNATKEVLPNPKLLEQYKQLAQTRKTDAEQVRTLALKVNRRDRGLIEPELFPFPRQDQREVLPAKFHGELVAAYASLLKQIGAGVPPSAEEIKADLEAAESGYRVNDLKKGETDALTPEETDKLHEELGRKRMARYGDAAQKIHIYCTESSLNVPSWNPSISPRLRDLFEWQWQFWINQDILNALNKANSGAPNVVQAPVKRVVWIRSMDAPGGAAAGSAGSGEGPALGTGDGSSGGMPGKNRSRGAQSPASPSASGEGGDSAASAEGAAVGSTIVIDPSAVAPIDYAVSFTGRKTNPLYDVRLVELKMVVRTESLPVVLDDLSDGNLITILDLDLVPIDPYTAIRDGYFYGDEPCSEVTLLLETVWLREWVAPLMPPDLVEALGIKTQPKTVAAAPAT